MITRLKDFIRKTYNKGRDSTENKSGGDKKDGPKETKGKSKSNT